MLGGGGDGQHGWGDFDISTHSHGEICFKEVITYEIYVCSESIYFVLNNGQ